MFIQTKDPKSSIGISTYQFFPERGMDTLRAQYHSYRSSAVRAPAQSLLCGTFWSLNEFMYCTQPVKIFLFRCFSALSELLKERSGKPKQLWFQSIISPRSFCCRFIVNHWDSGNGVIFFVNLATSDY